ncbi:hypothetical protein DXX93_02805 [Thalassotalea euphylliae]|uniref:STAS/SEC14 domain-containing protein n=1 Tax=Thalassotalea euphylliae TaxID=1655234 RepID=A0A3E0TN87_9GAMM|nr:hypothetical protein [Thalassotalea euphylliae]REL25582.1 hypothetical protein DXX93_02805 [Thalassotalea euphylliae]
MNIHGECEVSCNGNMLFGTLIGSFNEDGITVYTEQMHAQVMGFNGQPFVVLVDLTRVEGGTPEAYLLLDNYNQWLAKQSLVAKALLYDSAVQPDILFSRSPALDLQNTKLFTDRIEAIAWLQQQLDRATWNKE